MHGTGSFLFDVWIFELPLFSAFEKPRMVVKRLFGWHVEATTEWEMTGWCVWCGSPLCYGSNCVANDLMVSPISLLFLLSLSLSHISLTLVSVFLPYITPVLFLPLSFLFSPHRHSEFSWYQYCWSDQWRWCWRNICWFSHEGVSCIQDVGCLYTQKAQPGKNALL